MDAKEEGDLPACYQRSVQKPASLMVWGCISAYGMGSLHVLEGTMNAERYINVLEQHMLPSRRRLFQGRPCVFQQDNAKSEKKWTWRDIRPSMVTHTRNLCSALTHPKCTHTAVNTHTPWTHTRSSGQPFMLRRPGSSWGFGALLKGRPVVVLRVERALYIHSPHLQFLLARDSNS